MGSQYQITKFLFFRLIGSRYHHHEVPELWSASIENYHISIFVSCMQNHSTWCPRTDWTSPVLDWMDGCLTSSKIGLISDTHLSNTWMKSFRTIVQWNPGPLPSLLSQYEAPLDHMIYMNCSLLLANHKMYRKCQHPMTFLNWRYKNINSFFSSKRA